MQQSLSWFLSSDPRLGAINTNTNGNYFDVLLQEAFTVPPNAVNITAELQSAVVWNTGTNIIAGVNNVFSYDFGAGSVLRTVEIPQGNYDLHTLSVTIDALLQPDVPTGSILFELRGGFVAMLMTNKSLTNYIANVRFDLPQSPASILGFNPEIYQGAFPGLNNAVSYRSQSTSEIVDGHRSWILSCSLCTRGIRVNDKFLAALAYITFADIAPNSQYVYEPPRPLVVPTDIAKTTITTVSSYLTDARTGLPVSTEEYWSYTVILRYEVPILVPRLTDTVGSGCKHECKKRKMCSCR